MVSAAEFSRAAYGAWRLALFDKAGLTFFEPTVEAYWRSFHAAVILAPVYAIHVVLRLHDVETQAGFLQIFAAEALAYITGWVAFPLAMIYVSDRLGRFDRYLHYIVAHNWSAIVQMALFLAVTVLARGLLGGGVLIFLSLATTVAILTYRWFIAKSALDVTGGAAAAIVGLDLMISVILNMVTNRFL